MIPPCWSMESPGRMFFQVAEVSGFQSCRGGSHQAPLAPLLWPSHRERWGFQRAGEYLQYHIWYCPLIWCIYIYICNVYVCNYIYISYTRYGDFSTVLKLEAHDSTINHWFPEMNWVHDHFWAYFHEFTDLSFNAINVYKEFATGTGTLTVVCLNI